MATSTTTSVWRSGGGDTTKTAYAGSMLMVADFYLSATQVSGNVQKSSTDTTAVILPIGAVITEIQANAAGTGGTNPTFDLGFTLYSTGTASPEALLNEADADAGKQVFNWATATVPGASLGAVMSTSELVYITGRKGASAATGGSISGRITYYVPTSGAYTA
mgnify:FL=1